MLRLASAGPGSAGHGPQAPKDKPSIGPIEPQADDKSFMEMWKAYFEKMQASVTPPEPQ